MTATESATLAIDLHDIRDRVVEAARQREEAQQERETMAVQVQEIRRDVTELKAQIKQREAADLIRHSEIMGALSTTATEAAARSARWAVIVDRLTQKEIVLGFFALLIVIAALYLGGTFSGMGVKVGAQGVTVDVSGDALTGNP